MNFNYNIKANIKQKITTNLVILFLVVFFVSYFGIYSAMADIKKLRSEIITEKIEIEKKINREQNSSNLSIKLKKIEADSDKVSNMFIAKNNELEFIKILENIANYNNIEQNINLLPEKDVPGDINKTIVNISASGTYAEILNYIRDIESLPNYININFFSIDKEAESNKKEDTPDIVKLNIGAETFWK